MHGWISERVNGWIDGWVSGWTEVWMGGWMNKQWVGEWMDVWVGGWTDGWSRGKLYMTSGTPSRGRDIWTYSWRARSSVLVGEEPPRNRETEGRKVWCGWEKETLCPWGMGVRSRLTHTGSWSQFCSAHQGCHPGWGLGWDSERPLCPTLKSLCEPGVVKQTFAGCMKTFSPPRLKDNFSLIDFFTSMNSKVIWEKSTLQFFHLWKPKLLLADNSLRAWTPSLLLFVSCL